MPIAKTLTVALLALTLTTAPAAAPHSATHPAPRGDGGWKDRATLLDNRLKEAQDAEVLFIGDSITQGWEGAGKEAWNKFYGRRKAVNLGIGGDRTQHVLWRLQNAPLNGMKPKAAVVMIGTNNSNNEDNTPGQIADGVAAIVRYLREKLPETRVLLLAIFPRGENFNPQRGKLTQINQVLQKLDDGENVMFLDIGHRFLDANGLLPADIMPDYLHLSPKGYEIWAEAMEPHLSRLMGSAAVEGKSGAATSKVNSTANIDGDWTWSIKGPNDEMLESTMTLKTMAGNKISGSFLVTDDRKLEIQNGIVKGDELNFVVRRMRPQGGEMVYNMTGKVSGNQIKGKVTTEVDGQSQTQDWSAKRK